MEGEGGRKEWRRERMEEGDGGKVGREMLREGKGDKNVGKGRSWKER